MITIKFTCDYKISLSLYIYITSTMYWSNITPQCTIHVDTSVVVDTFRELEHS